MFINMDLVKSDPSLILTPSLMLEAEQRTLNLNTYITLLLRDLARDSYPFGCALSLVNEGNVSLAKRFILEHQLTETELLEFEEKCDTVLRKTNYQALSIEKQISKVKDNLEPKILEKCRFLKDTWQKAINQEHCHIAQRELLNAQNLLADEKSFKVDQPLEVPLSDPTVDLTEKDSTREEVSHEPMQLVEPGSDVQESETTSEKIKEDISYNKPLEPIKNSIPESVQTSDALLDQVKPPDLRRQAINVWEAKSQQYSPSLKDLLRPSDRFHSPPSYYKIDQSFRYIQSLQEGWQLEELKKYLQLFFYLSKDDRQQLDVKFNEVLIIYVSECLKDNISYEDFVSANQMYSDIIHLLTDNSKIKREIIEKLSLSRNCIDARAGFIANNTKTSFMDFQKEISSDIRNFPMYIDEANRRNLLNYGKVLFFYYRIRAFRKVQEFIKLIAFFTEYSALITNLATGNLELHKLYEVAKNHYEDALYQKTKNELTNLELKPELTFEETLNFVKQLPPYQIVPALNKIIERFSNTIDTHQAQVLIQMYRLILLLFDMQEPEELVFTSDKVLDLINIIKSLAEHKDYIHLVPQSEKLPISVLATLEIFVKETVAAVSVTDQVLVRHSIGRALDGLQKQRVNLEKTGSATRHLWHMLGDHWISILVERQRAISRHASLQLSLQSEKIFASQETPLIVYVNNVGPGHTQNIEVALISSDLSIKERTIFKIPVLRNGDKYTLQFIVKSWSSSGQADIRLLAKYSDVDNNLTIAAQDKTLILENSQERKFPKGSPYVWGQALKSDAKVFYGRQDVFDFLSTRFWGEERNKIISLQGERRMGKTSILHQLKARKIFGNYRVVYFDFQARYANISSMQEFLFHFTRRIASEARLPSEFRVERDQYRLGYLEDYDTFELWLDRVEAELKRRDTQIVIIFDEFEKMLGSVVDNTVNTRVINELLQYLRSVMLVRDKFNWIIAGSWNLVVKQRDYFSSLFGMALSYWISYLRPNDAIRLIQEPVQKYLTYDQAATERVLRLTGGHPFHIQIMCDELFNRARDKNSHQISVQDVNQVIDHTLQQVTEESFRSVWSSLNSTMSRKVLSAIAEAMQDPSNFVNKDNVFNFLRRRNPGLSEDSFYSVLDLTDGELVQREFIELHPAESDRIRIRSELLYYWLRKAKQLSTVLREER